MKVVLSPWFYGSCARYLIRPSAPSELQLREQYTALSQLFPQSTVQAQDLYFRHQDLLALLKAKKTDVFLLQYKDLFYQAVQFKESDFFIWLQRDFLISLLYYTNLLIAQKKYSQAFEICFKSEALFSTQQSYFSLAEWEFKAMQAQFMALYCNVFKRQGKLEQAIKIAQRAADLDLQLRPEESFDGYTTVLLNLVYLLHEDYKGPLAAPYIKKARQHVQNCFQTKWARFFNPALAKQQAGIAMTIATHLNGMIQLSLKDSTTPAQIWYQPFDETLQLAIQFFARPEDAGNCWNNPVIAWALIDLEIVEQLARKHDKFFVGSLQKGRYQNVLYYLYKGDQSSFKNRAQNLKADQMDDIALRDFYPPKSLSLTRGSTAKSSKLTPVTIGKPKRPQRSTATSQSAARDAAQPGVRKPEGIGRRCTSAGPAETHNYGQHFTPANVAALFQLLPKDEDDDENGGRRSKIPQILRSLSAKSDQHEVGNAFTTRKPGTWKSGQQASPVNRLRGAPTLGLSQTGNWDAKSAASKGLPPRGTARPGSTYRQLLGNDSQVLSLNKSKANKSFSEDLPPPPCAVAPPRVGSPELYCQLVPRSKQTLAALRDYKYGGAELEPHGLHFARLQRPYFARELALDEVDFLASFKTQDGRPKLDPTRFSPSQLETLASERIQKFYREIFLPRRQLVMKHQAKLSNLVRMIQKNARGHVYFARYKAVQADALTIQKYIRMQLAIRLKRKSVAAALQIQSYQRSRAAWRVAIQRQHAVIVMQTEIRARLEQRRYAQIQHLAYQLQAKYRRWAATGKMTPRKAAIIALQRFQRRRAALRQWKALSGAALLLQSVARQRIAESAFLKKRDAARALQGFLRTQTAQKAFWTAQWAATRIQAAVLCTKQRKLFLKQVKAAARIQVFFRANRGVICYQHSAHPISVIKANWRRAVAQRRLERQLQAAQAIQRASRHKTALMCSGQRLEAVKLLQNAFRNRHALQMALGKLPARGTAVLKCAGPANALGDARVSKTNVPYFKAAGCFLRRPQFRTEGDLDQRDAELLGQLNAMRAETARLYQTDKYLAKCPAFSPALAGMAPRAQLAEYYNLAPDNAMVAKRRAKYAQSNGKRSQGQEQKNRSTAPQIAQPQLLEAVSKLNAIEFNRFSTPKADRLSDIGRGVIIGEQALQGAAINVQKLADVDGTQKDAFQKTDAGGFIRATHCRFYSEPRLGPSRFGGLRGPESRNEILALELAEKGLLGLSQVPFVAGSAGMNAVAAKTLNVPLRCRDKLVAGRAVQVIQNAFRVKAARAKKDGLMCGVLAIKSVVQRRAAQKALSKERAAAEAIQAAGKARLRLCGKTGEMKFSMDRAAFFNGEVVGIQRRARSFLEQKTLHAQRAAAERIQSACLGHRLRWEREAAVTIQRAANNLRLLKAQDAVKNAAVAIELAFRRKTNGEKAHAARAIQMLWKRQNALPLNYVKKTIALQALLRGVAVRKRIARETKAANTIKQLLTRQLVRLDAVNKIQTAWLLQLKNIRLRRTTKAATRIQAFARGLAERTRIKKEYVAIRRIQMHYRKLITRKRVQQFFTKTLTLQRIMHGALERKALAAKVGAVVCIQKAVKNIAKTERKALLRKDLIKLTREDEAAARIQAVQRRRAQNEQQRKENAAASKIQRAARCFTIKRKIVYARIAANVIQRHFKHGPYAALVADIEHFKVQRASAQVIQSFFRSVSAIKKYKQITAGVRVLQKNAALHLKYNAVYLPTLLLQKHIRRWRTQQAMQNMTRLIVTIQKTIRAKQAPAEIVQATHSEVRKSRLDRIRRVGQPKLQETV